MAYQYRMKGKLCFFLLFILILSGKDSRPRIYFFSKILFVQKVWHQESFIIARPCGPCQYRMKVVLFILFFGFFLGKIKDPVLFYFIYKKKEMLFVQ